MAKPTVIYGGPYAHESEAILAEANKKKPDFDKLIEGWNTITQGAVEAIEQAKNPPEPFAGNWSNNHKVSKEEAENPPIPATIIYATPDKDVIDQDYKEHEDDPEKVVTVVKNPDKPVTKSKTADSKKSDDVDLDKL
jgi:hypothetical protein